MSRWTDQFKNHSFQKTWGALKAEVETSKVDDVTISTSVMELSRLSKAITYINTLIEGIDPELVPLTMWDIFDSQASACKSQVNAFRANRNIAHVIEANNHVDNLLSYVRPYMATKGAVGKALKDAAIEYSEMVEKLLKNLNSMSENVNEKTKVDAAAIAVLLNSASGLYSEIETARIAVLGDDETKGTQKEIVEIHANAQKKYEEIDSFHNEALIGTADQPSIQKEILGVKEEVVSTRDEIIELKDDVEVEIKDLNSFHEKIYGKLDAKGERSGGLLNEFSQRVTNLGEFEALQISKYNALNEQINTLLPGATSAGLAEAYKKMRESFEGPIKNANRIYYVAVSLMIFGAFYTAIDSIGWFFINFIDIKQWDVTLRALTQKLPFYAPVIWLAYYASKRRSEYHRLQQEYAHKEALASSYHSYKVQLEALDSKDSEMQKAFIAKTIDAIVYNASATLDGNHGDKMLAQEFMDKLVNNDSMLEIFKKKLGLGG